MATTSRRWITVARVERKPVFIGNFGCAGYSVYFYGRDYVFRSMKFIRWAELISALEETLRLHRLKSVALASDIKRRAGEITLRAEVERLRN